MIRWALFVVLAGCLTAYSLWIYLRVDVVVPRARVLALVRAGALVIVLMLLFDVRLPTNGMGGPSTEWALLDASLSMGAVGPDGNSPWALASARARELSSAGYDIATFGGEAPASTPDDPEPTELASRLVPALERAAEGGARSVVVLSDYRFQDAVAIRSALETLPLTVEFERFGDVITNAGVSRFDVPDFARPNEAVTAEIEVHGGGAGDTLTIEILQEDAVVATARVEAPTPGLRSRTTVQVPPPDETGRIRYSAVVRLGGDAFPADDAAVDYAAVGREEGALVVLSLVPDWEPRYLLPVLQEVTGLPALGYMRAGPDRFVLAGRALDRGGPVDSMTVRQAVTDAALVVVHGLGADADEWTRALVARPGRKILMARDEAGATLAGLTVEPPIAGEWYVSADVPPSPIAGSLSGTSLQGLPPLTDVIVATDGGGTPPILLQLRGAGSPVGALHLADRSTGRVAIALSSGFWRWASREVGRDAYRSLWSGVVGWLLADQAVSAAEPRPLQWVVERGEPVVWTLPDGSVDSRIRVQAGDSIVVDTVAAEGGTITTGALSPGSYAYTVGGPEGDTIASGRFDVAARSDEMVPIATEPLPPVQRATLISADAGGGRPLRTSPWPYLLVIIMLCGEWIGRRRSGLR